MEKIVIAATARTPSFEFDPQAGTLRLAGESYPEDPTKFFAGPMAGVYAFLQQRHEGPLRFKFELAYFNSSSAKVIMDLFSAIEASAEAGNDVTVEWFHAEDDDNMKELGEEFSEELVKTRFEMRILAA